MADVDRVIHEPARLRILTILTGVDVVDFNFLLTTLGLTKGTLLKVEIEGSRIVLRKDVNDALSRSRGRFKLPAGQTPDDLMRSLRGRAPGDPLEPADDAAPTEP